MSAYYWIQLVVSVAAVGDMYRRSPTQWALADRQRGWWTGIVGVLAFVGAGPLGVVLYLTLVVPAFGAGERDPFAVSPAFRKG